jgi:anion-transporting  ArsA/GET3 family ATPase
MSEYLVDHGFGRLSRRLASLGVVDAVATAIPGLAGILVLGRIKQLEREAELDLIIVDSPASGHAVSLMGGVEGLSDAARSGPVRAQADEVREMLADAKRAQVALVTLAEETPVNETVETAYKLEEDIGIKLGPVVVNGLVGLDLGPVGLDEERAPLLARLEQAGLSGDDALRAAAGIERSVAWTKGTMRRQLAQIERLGQALPLSQIWLRQFDPELPLADRAPWLAAEMTRGWRDRHERAGG